MIFRFSGNTRDNGFRPFPISNPAAIPQVHSAFDLRVIHPSISLGRKFTLRAPRGTNENFRKIWIPGPCSSFSFGNRHITGNECTVSAGSAERRSQRKMADRGEESRSAARSSYYESRNYDRGKSYFSIKLKIVIFTDYLRKTNIVKQYISLYNKNNTEAYISISISYTFNIS